MHSGRFERYGATAPCGRGRDAHGRHLLVLQPHQRWPGRDDAPATTRFMEGSLPGVWDRPGYTPLHAPPVVCHECFSERGNEHRVKRDFYTRSRLGRSALSASRHELSVVPITDVEGESHCLITSMRLDTGRMT